jgi:hypothetical protein
MKKKLSHFDEQGGIKMVDVSEKKHDRAPCDGVRQGFALEGND